jgi:acyl-coenzyme A synthetase/AMP-(fatty) acid ligase
VLAAHPRVAEACAVVIGDGIDARLTAFTVAASRPGEEGPDDGAGVRRLDALELRRHCAERLPLYLVPDDIRVVDMLPRTVNGKIDRLTLASGVHPGPRD